MRTSRVRRSIGSGRWRGLTHVTRDRREQRREPRREVHEDLLLHARVRLFAARVRTADVRRPHAFHRLRRTEVVAVLLFLERLREPSLSS